MSGNPTESPLVEYADDSDFYSNIPEELVNGFFDDSNRSMRWNTAEIGDLDSINLQLLPFCQANLKDENSHIADLPRSEELATLMVENFKFTDQIFRTIYPRVSDRELDILSYHNADHAKLTAWNAAKAYLGYLAAEHLPFDQDFFNLLVTTGCLHEIDDWWELANTDGKPVPVSPDRYKQALKLISERLAVLSIHPDDFNRAIMLDDFTHTLDESVRSAIALPKGNGLIKRDTTPVKEYLPEEPKNLQPILTLLGKFIRGADYTQALDHEYQIPVYRKHNGQLYLYHHGVAVLANEMLRIRPQAIPAAWKNGQEFDWRLVGTTDYFLNQLKLYLEPVIPYLDSFNHGSGIPEDVTQQSYDRFITSVTQFNRYNRPAPVPTDSTR